MFAFSGREFAEAERAAETALEASATLMAEAEATMQHQQLDRSATALQVLRDGAR
jgi:hypothetical protein